MLPHPPSRVIGVLDHCIARRAQPTKFRFPGKSAVQRFFRDFHQPLMDLEVATRGTFRW
jgi:hypothetical protein